MKGGALTRSWISISFSWVYYSNRTCGTENQSRKQTCRVKQSLRCITTCTDASEIRVLQRGINVSGFFCLWFSLHFYSPRTNVKHEVRTYTRSGSYPLPRALRSTLYSPAVVSWLNHLVVPRLPKVSLSQIGPNYHPLKWQFLSCFQYPQVYFLNTNLVNLTVTLTRGSNAINQIHFNISLLTNSELSCPPPGVQLSYLYISFADFRNVLWKTSWCKGKELSVTLLQCPFCYFMPFLLYR